MRARGPKRPHPRLPRANSEFPRHPAQELRQHQLCRTQLPCDYPNPTPFSRCFRAILRPRTCAVSPGETRSRTRQSIPCPTQATKNPTNPNRNCLPPDRCSSPWLAPVSGSSPLRLSRPPIPGRSRNTTPTKTADSTPTKSRRCKPMRRRPARSSNCPRLRCRVRRVTSAILPRTPWPAAASTRR